MPDDALPVVGVEEGLQLLLGGDRSPVGLGHSEVRQARAHDQLVLGELEGVGARVHGHAIGDEGAQDVLRHVLVVEGDDVDVGDEGAHGLEIVIIADGGRGELGRHPSPSASTRRSSPSSTAGAIIIRASCPPPITPTRKAMCRLPFVSTILAHRHRCG